MKYLVVGLGNIGAEYATTRHNMGFMVLDAWAQASNAVFTTERYGAVAEISFKGRQFVLLKPSTYMNLSGNAVRYWLQKLDLGIESLLVISDDLNLPFGTIRMRARGSDGGHNGLENIIRIGIGNDFARGAQVDFVLGGLTPEELATIPELSERIAGGIKTWAILGPERAMNQLNTRVKPAAEKEQTHNI
jgi:PTH1 family peptidyl-tRNA hydrolase